MFAHMSTKKYQSYSSHRCSVETNEQRCEVLRAIPLHSWRLRNRMGTGLRFWYSNLYYSNNRFESALKLAPELPSPIQSRFALLTRRYNSILAIQMQCKENTPLLRLLKPTTFSTPTYTLLPQAVLQGPGYIWREFCGV
jgi:hypothetical protein